MFFWQNVLWSGTRARSLNQHKRGWDGGGKGLEVMSILCWLASGQYPRLASRMTPSKASSEDLANVTSCPIRSGSTTWTGQSLLKSLLLDSTFRNRKEGREEIRQELKPVKTTLFPHKCHLFQQNSHWRLVKGLKFKRIFLCWTLLHIQCKTQNTVKFLTIRTWRTSKPHPKRESK